MHTQLTLLVFLAVLQVVILLLLLRNRSRHPMGSVTGTQKETALRKVFDVQGKLTSMQWNVDMILSGKEGDFGKPNLAQKEFLHQVSDDCTLAAKELQDALKDLGCSLTSKIFGKTSQH